MSHTIYNTNAIVLKRLATGEADVTLWLLTEELGLIVARAQSARKELGKMRGYLQLFTILRVSLVRGKYVWRITGTEAHNQEESINMTQIKGEALCAFAKVAKFIHRMTLADVQTQQHSSELFDIVVRARLNLTNINHTSKIEEIELITVAKILANLGYIAIDTVTDIESQKITQTALARVVNNAIVESHL